MTTVRTSDGEVEPPEREVLPLATDFPAGGDEEWIALATAILNKKRPENRLLSHEQARERLRTRLPGGLVTEALYLPPGEPVPLGYPGSMPFTRGVGPRSRNVPWDIRQLHDDPDPVGTHRSVLSDLEHGVTSLWFEVGEACVAAGDLPAVLEGVLLDLAPVAVSSSTDQVAAARALCDVWRNAPAHPSQVRGSLGIDPLGSAVVQGRGPDLDAELEVGLACAAPFGRVRPFVVDSRTYHDAGGSEVDEVGCAVATGVTYLRCLELAGISSSVAFGLVEFRVTASADQFLTIAALRALRRLWARVGELSGVPEPARGAEIHAVTSWRMITRDDPWVNILRSTLATFGAAAGGAQAITTLPFDTACGLPDAASRRIARNTQVLLAEESHVAAVTDPGGGSWYVEDLTNQLAGAAWAWFQEIERAGGMPAAMASGLVTDRLAASRAELDRALAHRRRPLTGVSSFPQVAEEPLRRVPRPFQPPAQGVTRRRDAEVFEAMRDRSRAAAAAGHPSTVFLAALGSQRDFGARLTFTSALLSVAGVTVVTSDGADPRSIAEQATATSPFVILCSSANGYAEHGPATLKALRAAGLRHVYLAGRAAELSEAAGSIDGTVFDGMDVVVFLSQLLDILEAQK
ncbi:MAG: methylmalonyl-CoA mutase [Actinomycetota bacterium]|nr:methylmalonyl-CoA mutase [Actinomycetota bacterium]